MAKRSPPQVLLLGSDTQLGYALCSVEERAKESGKISSLLKKNSQTFDVSDFAEVKKQFKSLLPDLVINCNAYLPPASVMSSDFVREKLWEKSVLGADNIGKVCAFHGIPVIHISSCDVFGNTRAAKLLKPLTETDVINPIGYAGFSQVGAEHCLLRLGQRHDVLSERGFKHVIVRTGPVFGIVPGATQYTVAMNTVVNWAARYASSPSDTIEAATDVAASPVFADDLADFLLFMASRLQDTECGIYHFGNSGCPTALEYASLLSRELKGFKRVSSSTRSEIQNSDSRRQVKASTPLDCSKVEDTGYRIRPWFEAASSYAKACNKHV